MAWKMWLVRFQLWFLCLASVNSRQVGRRFADAGEVILSNSQMKMGKVVDSDGFRELGFLGRQTMVHALSREDELMKTSRRRISDIRSKKSEENKDSQKFSAKFEDHMNNEAKGARFQPTCSSRSNQKPTVYARKTRGKEEESGEDEEEEEAKKVAKLMRNDYREISHSRPPANNHQPRHLQETSKP